MFKKIKFHRPHYFPKHPTRGLMEMYWSVGLMDLGIAAVTIFEPIYLFILGYSLSKIMIFYLLIYGLVILILPLMGRLVGRLGYEHSIFYSQFFLIAFYVCLFAISFNEVFFYIAPIMLAIQKGLYWLAFHADLAIFLQDKQRGREMGGLQTLSMMAYVVGPLIGGIILEWSSFAILFIIASGLFVLSSLPLLKIKEIHSQEKFSYGKVFKELIDKKHRRNFLAYLGFGEELIVMTVWPIFIYTIIKDYLEIGTLVAIATLITGFVVLYLGKAADKHKKMNILRLGSIIYAVSWLIRGFARNAWQVVSLDAVSRFSKEMVFVPMEAMTYSTAKKLGPLPYAVFIEQSVAISKFLAALLVIIIIELFATSATPWLAIFILAAVFSLLYLSYQQKIRINGVNKS